MNEYFECYNCGQVVQGFVASQQVECCEIPSYQRIEKPESLTATEARWEIWDLMDEEVVEIWRAQVADGDTCPICNGERIIEEPHWNAQDELVRCPLCGPVFASKGPDAPEPAPF